MADNKMYCRIRGKNNLFKNIIIWILNLYAKFPETMETGELSNYTKKIFF